MEEIDKNISSKSLLVDEDSLQTSTIDKESLKKATQKSSECIPNSFIEVKLASNGKIEGIPKVLHFRDYSASETLDLITPDDEDKPKLIAKILTDMCYEKFDIKKLPIEDVLLILYTLHANFISDSISKKIYIDDTLNDEEIDNESNIEEVEIPVSSLRVQLLGCDKSDKEISSKFKVPFKVVNKDTKETMEFKLATLEDSILAQNYCKEVFDKDIQKYLPIRKEFVKINSIKDKKEAEKERDDFILNHYSECRDYEAFVKSFTLFVGKVIQALQIVSYNGKECKTLEEKWEVYNSKLGISIWNTYSKVVETYPYGLIDEVEVFSSSLNKKITRKIGFQLSDFISDNRTKDNDRYSVLFD